MPARDRFHTQVVQALQKDGWTVTHDPLSIPFAGTYTEIDLGAQKLIAAEKGQRRIAVEIKSFVGTSQVSEFHIALGQYLNYEEALARFDPERILYLAIPVQVHQSFFAQDIIQTIIRRHSVKLLVFDPLSEAVVSWTS